MNKTLARAVQQLPPEELHQVIKTRGLAACGDLLAVATPKQLQRVLDLDLWRPPRPGMDPVLDPNRFAEWVEMLVESDAATALQTLANMDESLVTAAIAQHVRVFDRASVPDVKPADCEVGGYVVEARRGETWDTIVRLLQCLANESPGYFQRVMRGCVSLSNSKPEVDGLDNLLTDSEQRMFDLATAREERREQQGYVTAADARAFLHAARKLRLNGPTAPSTNPVAQAYFRAIEWTAPPESGGGEVTTGPQSLLAAPGATSRFARLRTFMEFGAGAEELGFLANAIAAGCAVQTRPLTPHEASEAAAAVCNLGLENWPVQWRQDSLVGVFQVGWNVLYKDVCMHAAEALLHAAAESRTSDREIKAGLRALRLDLARHWRAGVPWLAREALDVILLLDQPVWAALRALIDEFPVIHAGMRTARGSAALAVDPFAFEFISENRQIQSVRDFIQELPDRLND